MGVVRRVRVNEFTGQPLVELQVDNVNIRATVARFAKNAPGLGGLSPGEVVVIDCRGDTKYGIEPAVKDCQIRVSQLATMEQGRAKARELD